MNRYMIDSNIIDQLITMESIPDGDYYIPATVVEELASIPDNKKEKRMRIFLKLCKLQATLVPVITVLDHCRLGYCVFASEDEGRYYRDICNKMKSVDSSKEHIKDAMIAVAAKQKDCILVTEDKLLRDTVKKLGCSACSWNEFLGVDT